jgi:UDP-2,3-diacylglucosamine pyrophosphatase LpxH
VILSRLASLTSAGRHVIYLTGNRDYFADEAGRAAGLDVFDAWDLCAPGVPKVRFEHGHLINRSDRQYLRWHAFTRSLLAKAAFRALPVTWQKSLAGRIEARLTRTNIAYKNYEPALELEAWASSLKGDGVSAAVLGHFHLDAVREVRGLSVRFVPQFREEGLHLRIGAGGLQEIVPFRPRRGL